MHEVRPDNVVVQLEIKIIQEVELKIQAFVDFAIVLKDYKRDN